MTGGLTRVSVGSKLPKYKAEVLYEERERVTNGIDDYDAVNHLSTIINLLRHFDQDRILLILIIVLINPLSIYAYI